MQHARFDYRFYFTRFDRFIFRSSSHTRKNQFACGFGSMRTESIHFIVAHYANAQLIVTVPYRVVKCISNCFTSKIFFF